MPFQACISTWITCRVSGRVVPPLNSEQLPNNGEPPSSGWRKLWRAFNQPLLKLPPSTQIPRTRPPVSSPAPDNQKHLDRNNNRSCPDRPDGSSIHWNGNPSILISDRHPTIPPHKVRGFTHSSFSQAGCRPSDRLLLRD